jgi:two-component system chemotaxis response regulator CheB
MEGHDIIVIGGSAGGLEAVRRICERLPADFPAALFVVIHISPTSRSVLPELLSRASALPARHPASEEPIKPGTIYVAPPDMHMLLRPERVILRRGPHENRTRPAIDPLFRSAAIAFRSRVIGVVLSGLLDDGCAGLIAIKACGGLCVVQQPDDAMWPEMPRNALAHDHVDHCAPAAELPAMLGRLVRTPSGQTPAIPKHLILEDHIAAQEALTVTEPVQLGRPTRLSCPQCGGVLNEVADEGTTRFRCQIGHAFTAESLIAAQNDELERAMESALRMHRERMVLFRRMQERSEARALSHSAALWRAGAEESEQAAKVIGEAIASLRSAPLSARATDALTRTAAPGDPPA